MGETKKKKGRPAGAGKKTEKNRMSVSGPDRRVQTEIWVVVLLALGIFLAVALNTEAAGTLGSLISFGLKGTFGLVAYGIPYAMMGCGVLLFISKAAGRGRRTGLLWALIFWMAVILNSCRFIDLRIFSAQWKNVSAVFHEGAALENGGVAGMYPGALLVKGVGSTGLYIICVAVILVCLLLLINTSIAGLMASSKEKRNVRRALKKERYARIEAEVEAELAQERRNLRKTVLVPGPGEEDADEDSGSGVSAATPLPERETPLFPSFLNPRRFLRLEGRGVASERKPEADPLGDLPRNQQKIMNYMQDDTLFGETGPSVDHGLQVPEELEHAEPLMTESPWTSPSSRKKSEPGAFFSGRPAMTEPPAPADPAFRPEPLRDRETAPAPVSASGSGRPYKKPPPDLLKKVKTGQNTLSPAELKAKAEKLEETLRNFNVSASVLQVTQGPAVTRYEIQPSVGVKVNSIVRLADDIALNLEARSIRMEAPIPGKAAVGIEVENDRVNLVSIRDMIESGEFQAAKSRIAFAVGRDIGGNAVVADLKAMPHLLIAGSTGSGKSVCINSIILSILFKASPDEVRLLLIDPKVVELGGYNGIPHLLIPVVTEPAKAAAALDWAVAEMTDRYRKFAGASVRDLESYNRSCADNGQPEEKLPQVVIIIDELADLMMAAPAKVEEAICRLAQMARAAGMHLIVATQRPSVDIITGVIKANIPSRIAFAVSSQFDSRTILDMGGAEKLVGKGDMLFNPLGRAKPLRVQGAFVSDGEVQSVIRFLKNQNDEAVYAGEVMDTIEKAAAPPQDEPDSGEDPLLPEAVETVVRAEQASVSMLQRRFRIGYNRAARMIDQMEAWGIIGPADGSRPRTVLLSEAQWAARQQTPQEGEKSDEVNSLHLHKGYSMDEKGEGTAAAEGVSVPEPFRPEEEI